MIDKLSVIVSKSHRSNLLTEMIEAEYNRTFVNRCEPRWNSCFKMSRCAAGFNWKHSALPEDMKLDDYSVAILKEFVSLMEPFERAFLAVQRADFPTICSVIPCLYNLRWKLKVTEMSVVA